MCNIKPKGDNKDFLSAEVQFVRAHDNKVTCALFL